MTVVSISMRRHSNARQTAAILGGMARRRFQFSSKYILFVLMPAVAMGSIAWSRLPEEHSMPLEGLRFSRTRLYR